MCSGDNKRKMAMATEETMARLDAALEAMAKRYLEPQKNKERIKDENTGRIASNEPMEHKESEKEAREDIKTIGVER